jgi:hypothetical protein
MATVSFTPGFSPGLGRKTQKTVLNGFHLATATRAG